MTNSQLKELIENRMKREEPTKENRRAKRRRHAFNYRLLKRLKKIKKRLESE